MKKEHHQNKAMSKNHHIYHRNHKKTHRQIARKRRNAPEKNQQPITTADIEREREREKRSRNTEKANDSENDDEKIRQIYIWKGYGNTNNFC